jgi:hypothetical protein
MTPAVVIRAILLPVHSQNQIAPSGPSVIPLGPPPGVGTAYSMIDPEGISRPMLLATASPNQRSPYNPSVISSELLSAVGIARITMLL